MYFFTFTTTPETIENILHCQTRYYSFIIFVRLLFHRIGSLQNLIKNEFVRPLLNSSAYNKQSLEMFTQVSFINNGQTFFRFIPTSISIVFNWILFFTVELCTKII